MQEQIDKLTVEIDALEAERRDLFLKRAPIDERLNANYEELKALREQKATLEVEQGALPWSTLLQADPPFPIYKECERRLSELSLQRSGYFPDTMQACVRIALYRDDDEHTEKVHQGLVKLLPEIIAHPKYNGKLFDIFEHTLSASGGYHLVVKEDGQTVVDHRWNKKEFPSLLEALKYVQRYHYYEEGKKT